ncbi:MAG TPA: chemotaxis protein CheW [Vicinamibacterales bacterium]|jgi:two-component system chemotaxis sensor kinase CheA
MDDNEVLDLIKEFLIESNENLARLEQEMLALEQRPNDLALLGSVFRTIHTIKGTCGFLGFDRLEGVTHVAENILNQLRSGERALTPSLVSLILEAVDAVKTILANIEATQKEGADQWGDLRARLQQACDVPAAPAPEPAIPAPGTAAAPNAAPAISATPTPVTTPVATPAAAAKPVPAAAPSEPAQAATPEVEVAAAQRGTSVVDSTIRVDVGLLDKLMNLVGELVLARNQILQVNSRREEAALNATSQRLNLITTQLQEGVMKTRMQPIGVVWNKLPRVVRDMASSLQKQIRVEMDGAETELDKSIIEAIKDPLTHIVRNCCDHGIEKPERRVPAGKNPEGRLLLRAFHEGGHVNIEISDDGGGIDPKKLKDKALQKGLVRPEQAERMSDREAVNLVFLPGLSTAEKVTNISGRGVGMDVVKTNIEKIGGGVDVISRVGAGTTVKIKIPLTLAIIPGLVVNSGSERFVIPQVSLQELVRLEGASGRKQIELIHGTPVYRRRGTLLPIAYLDAMLGLRTGPHDAEIVNIVVLQADGREFGLVVDRINDTQEIVVKPLGKQLKGLSAYAGATIMGDGRVALILDVHGLAEMSGVLNAAQERGHSEAERHEHAAAGRQNYLVFRSGSFERLAVPLSLVARLEEFPLAQIEHAGGRLVIQYRGQILHLVQLSALLENRPVDVTILRDPVQVVVFSDRDHVIGLIVDQVVDIVDEAITVRQSTEREGLAGVAVVGKKVTDFLDLVSVIRSVDDEWFGDEAQKEGAALVMVVDASPFSRALTKNSLELAGHTVIEAISPEEALARLEKERVNVVVASVELPRAGAAHLVRQLRSKEAFAMVRALAVTARAADVKRERADLDYDEYLLRSDREGLLRAILRGNVPPVEPDLAMAIKRS